MEMSRLSGVALYDLDIKIPPPVVAELAIKLVWLIVTELLLMSLTAMAPPNTSLFTKADHIFQRKYWSGGPKFPGPIYPYPLNRCRSE